MGIRGIRLASLVVVAGSAFLLAACAQSTVPSAGSAAPVATVTVTTTTPAPQPTTTTAATTTTHAATSIVTVTATPEATVEAPEPTVTVTADPGVGLVRAEMCSYQDYYTLSQGSDRFVDVRLLQSVLSALNYDVGPIDGVFGSVTADAVRRYQTNHGLVVDGVVGDQTWMSLRDGFCG